MTEQLSSENTKKILLEGNGVRKPIPQGNMQQKKRSADVVVENVHLSDSLIRLSYRVSSMMDERERKEKERLEKEV